jgi:hypothetical protein
MYLYAIVQNTGVARLPRTRRSLSRAFISGAVASALALAVCSGVRAQAPANIDVAEVRKQIDVLRAEQARIAELQARTEASIRALEASVGIASPPASGPGPDPVTEANPIARTANAAPPPTAARPPESTLASRLNIAGDMRVRAQADRSNDRAVDRYSAQVRGRLGATYAVSDRVSVGARLVTGDYNDPNSTDVQLSGFDNKFPVSLDLAYTKLDFGKVQFYGGKIPQPFVRTELVWDGDVTPQGLSANYKQPLGGGTIKANGLYFVIDEQAGGPDSTMAGGQLAYESPAFGAWKYDVAAAYYHYSLGSTAGADAGDYRTNLHKPDGTYLSQFHLGDLIVGATYTGFGERWPLRIVSDTVRNFGAATEADIGYGVDVLLGRASKTGDWRVGYGYAVVEADAVFAAFSQDNTSLATNYRQHLLSADYVIAPGTSINATWARYKSYNASDTPGFDSGDWLDRFRLALLVTF